MENVTADSPSSFLQSVMLLICTSEILFIFRMFRIVRAAAPMLILTAVMYTFYLYFSFSGYSEISRATGLVDRKSVV